ncbi:PaaX family transcriptional regulator C-terminal domain-containing protein [Sulfitobacter sp. PR48]|uniref:PaaX family transcriptional regulator C-terminal domain-containing protein n=1 Tax=Sulfitobacter sp. PR48 TaxID=3028383 RepID=UPI00237AE1A4|nr:PaaX family transcriptional regulator C-terminal domain-containing protein [Sulfitobacter sp. PR48]MDD9719673.1 PaaX family transcriptional regulator C-terminal domain-containing protein [Sulfitobacter sp. PR48]
MRTENFITLTAPLRAVGGGRVWSLMISLFGDLAQEQGTAIDGPVLSAMMTLLEVKPEAARVALHRLRNDGWVNSDKVGRISRHSLSEKGRAESAAATPRIYSTPDDGSGGWQLVLLETAEDQTVARMGQLGFTPLAPRLFVGPADAVSPPGALSLPGTTAPDWLRAQLHTEPLVTAYANLAQTLKKLAADLPESDTMTPLQIAVLRGLIVHNWRRLVLKNPPLPLILTDPDGPARQSHLMVADLLARFPRPSLRDLTT